MARLLSGLLAAFLSYAGLPPAFTAHAQDAAATGSLSTTSFRAPNSYKVRPPTRGIYHAAFPGFGPAEDTVTRRHIDRFSRNISGKDLTWAYFSDNWFDGISFPRRDVRTIAARGVIPFVRIMPRSTWQACTDRKYSLDKIARGAFDRQLRRYARAAAEIDYPLIMEFGTEVDGDWFPWSGACNGGGERTGYGSPRLADGPERFRDAYRRLITIFRQEGAHNVTWVMHFNGSGAPDAAWNRPSAYYPGDDYIDWLGLSVYGAQTPATIRQWNPRFREVMDHAYRRVAAVSRSKPIALLEFGVIEHEQRPDWITSALSDLANGRYPRIKAMAWWHSDWRNSDGTWSRMKLDTSEASLAAYRAGVAHPAFVTTPRITR